MSSLAQKATHGLFFTSIAIIVSKFSALLAQWVLGYFLMPEDFGIIAIITIAQLIVTGFREVGLNQQLVNLGKDYDEHAKRVLRSVQYINILGVLFMFALAPIFAKYYNDPRLTLLIAAISLTIPVQAIATSHRAKLAINMAFKKIAQYETYSVLISNFCLLVAAAAGLNVYSYVIAQLVLTVSAALLYRKKCGALPGKARVSWTYFKSVLNDSKWLMLNSYSINLSLRGDYLALSLFISKTQLGFYYFAYQLTESIVQLLCYGLNQVVLPMFSSIRENSSQVKDGLEKGLRFVALAAGFLALSIIVWIPWLIHMLWGGKWDSAILMAQIIGVSIPFTVSAHPFSTAVLEALKKYKLRSLLTLIDGISVVTIVSLVAYHSSLIAAVIALSIQRATIGTLYYFAVMQVTGTNKWKALLNMLQRNCVFLALAFSVLLVNGLFIFQFETLSFASFFDQVWRYLILITVFFLGYLITVPRIGLDIKELIRSHKN